MKSAEIMFSTSRLRIRGFQLSDLDDFAAMCADLHVMRYVGDGTGLDREQVARWIEICQSRYQERGFGTSAVFERDTGDFVGYCGVVRPAGQTFSELIYVLNQAAWGKGYATEVAGPMIEYVFGPSDVGEIWATIDVRNPTLYENTPGQQARLAPGVP